MPILIDKNIFGGFIMSKTGNFKSMLNIFKKKNKDKVKVIKEK